MTRVVVRFGSRLTVTLVDSITETTTEDAGRVVVSGSHGGASAAHYALQIAASLYVFNDAGIGKDSAGIAALDLLAAADIAACTVSHQSARIGEAADALANGVVSALNDPARRMGLTPGTRLLAFLEARDG